MISLGASSESLMMNADTDFGPRVSFELNSLFPSSLTNDQQTLKQIKQDCKYFKISSDSCG
jgi:hypothetical protein